MWKVRSVGVTLIVASWAHLAIARVLAGWTVGVLRARTRERSCIGG